MIERAQPSGGAGPITEKPILMSAPMAIATLKGEKTQTRRVVRFKWPDWNRNHAGVSMVLGSNGRPAFTDMGPNVSPEMLAMLGSGPGVICPYGDQGDRLWAKETWRTLAEYDQLPPREVPVGSPILHEAGAPPLTGKEWGRIRQSIFCMRWMARSVLEITDVRVERLQAITDTDALAEGCSGHDPEPASQGGTIHAMKGRSSAPSPRAHYTHLWDSLNGEREGASWAANPWVWAIAFKRVTT